VALDVNMRTFTKIGTPYLNRIQVLGHLFGSSGGRIEKRELLLLISPRVVGTVADAARVAERIRNVTPSSSSPSDLPVPAACDRHASLATSFALGVSREVGAGREVSSDGSSQEDGRPGEGQGRFRSEVSHAARNQW